MYRISEALGWIATLSLIFFLIKIGLNFIQLGFVLGCIAFIEFGCFAWRDRLNEAGQN